MPSHTLGEKNIVHGTDHNTTVKRLLCQPMVDFERMRKNLPWDDKQCIIVIVGIIHRWY